MSYQEVYKQKLTTADEAVKAVKSGDWVDYGWSVCSADALDKALARRMGELTDVKIRGGILTHKPAIFDVPNAAEHFLLELLAHGRHRAQGRERGLLLLHPPAVF